ncbi:MAG: beta-ketoacyl-ACP synthase II [bacterium]
MLRAAQAMSPRRSDFKEIHIIKRVVITGVGCVSPVGLSVEESWNALIAGQSGIATITAFDPDEWKLKTRVAGELKGFDPHSFMDRKEAKRVDRFSQMGLAAAQEAIAQSGLAIEGDFRYEVGTIVPSAVGGIISLVAQAYSLEKRGARRVDPFTIPKLMPNAASGFISMKFGTMGPSYATVSACASGTDAIGTAVDMIRAGRARAMIAGGAEAAIEPIAVAGFEQAHALCTDSNDAPEKASRPFDASRSGFVMGEGAGVLVLEDEELALERGATILGEIAGWGAAADGYHMTAPDPEGRGGTQAVRAAMANGEIDKSEVLHINAHGTSTPMNDKVESLVIRNVFGSQAYNIPVSSTKSMTGHLGGATGALEAVICTKIIETGVAPPTINYEHNDPECDLDYIPGTARTVGKGVVLSNSFGFGGHSSCLAIRPYDQQ